jgi:hypothetical protein
MNSIGHRLLDLLDRSVIVQSLITLMLVGAVVYMALCEHPIPDVMQNLTWAVVSFWMGTKVEYGARELANRRER